MITLPAKLSKPILAKKTDSKISIAWKQSKNTKLEVQWLKGTEEFANLPLISPNASSVSVDVE